MSSVTRKRDCPGVRAPSRQKRGEYAGVQRNTAEDSNLRELILGTSLAVSRATGKFEVSSFGSTSSAMRT
jgi:hypothetical protein